MAKKTKIEIACPNCDAEYNLSYDAEIVEDIPTQCPFCGEFLPEDFEPLKF